MAELFNIPAKLSEMQEAGKGGADVARDFHDHICRCTIILGGTLSQTTIPQNELAAARKAFLDDVADNYDHGFNKMKELTDEQG